jgi:trigger factor
VSYQRILGQQIPFDEDMQANLAKRAERKVRAALLLGEIAKTEKLDISNDDLEQRFKALAESSGKHIAKVRAEHQGEKRQELEQEILQGKLLEYLRSKATIRDAAPSTSTTEAQEQTK